MLTTNLSSVTFITAIDRYSPTVLETRNSKWLLIIDFLHTYKKKKTGQAPEQSKAVGLLTYVS